MLGQSEEAHRPRMMTTIIMPRQEKVDERNVLGTCAVSELVGALCCRSPLEVLAGLEYATDAAIKAFSNSQMTQWAMVHKETWSQKVESEVRPMFTRHWHQHRSSQRSDGTVGPRKVEDAWLTY